MHVAQQPSRVASGGCRKRSSGRTNSCSCRRCKARGRSHCSSASAAPTANTALEQHCVHLAYANMHVPQPAGYGPNRGCDMHVCMHAKKPQLPACVTGLNSSETVGITITAGPRLLFRPFDLHSTQVATCGETGCVIIIIIIINLCTGSRCAREASVQRRANNNVIIHVTAFRTRKMQVFARWLLLVAWPVVAGLQLHKL